MGGIVKREKLSRYIIQLRNNTVALDRLIDDPGTWRTMFIEEPEKFCAPTAVCTKDMDKAACAKAVTDCTNSQDLAVSSAVKVFSDLGTEFGQAERYLSREFPEWNEQCGSDAIVLR